jgi:D-sedoheptulose 7-phosphate isomerase
MTKSDPHALAAERARAFRGRALELLAALDVERIAEVSAVLYRAKEAGRTIFVFGNGGSHSMATHLAADLGKGTKGVRPGQRLYKVLSLDNPAWLTAQANDGEGVFTAGGYPGTYRHGYDGAFVGPLENLLSKDDVLVALSSSGNSPNVVNALLFGRERGATTVAIVGFDGGEAARISDHVILVPTEPGAYGLVESLHGVVHHMLYECARRIEEA